MDQQSTLSNSHYDESCTICMLGNTAVGKSSIVKAFKYESSFNTDVVPTIGFDFFTKIINVDDVYIKAIVYDTSGQERYLTISKNYIRNGDGVIIVYDITNRDSFESVRVWMNNIQQLRNDSASIIIVGNKTDLEHKRTVETQEGQDLANELG